MTETEKLKTLFDALLDMSLLVWISKQDAKNLEETFRAYADKLTSYPREQVLAALGQWPDEHSYWPSWERLKEAIETCDPDRKPRPKDPSWQDDPR
jgi:hypothetical protein